jgi:hypothetical protein
MAYSYTLTAVIPASAREIYDAWLDSLAHSETTGGRAQVSAELGGEFSASDRDDLDRRLVNGHSCQPSLTCSGPPRPARIVLRVSVPSSHPMTPAVYVLRQW